MKKIVASIVVSSSLVFSSGIPVVDVVSNAQAMAQNLKEVAQWAEQASRWAKEVDHYKSQLGAYQDQLLSATQIRDSVQFVKDISDFYSFAKNYSDDYMSLSTDILNSNTPIGIQAKALFKKYNLFNDCEGDYLSKDEKNICKNKMVRRVHEVAVYQEYNKNLNLMANDLNDLAVSLANSQDIKESQDIGNAIQLKIAQIDLTKTKIELMNAQNERLDKVEQKQKEQLISQTRGKSADFRELRRNR